MTPEDAPEPLHRFPIFQTSDFEEFAHAILTKVGGVKADVNKYPNFKARGNLVQLQDIALIHGASSASVSIDYSETKLFKFTAALIGRGEAVIGGKATAINERQSCIVSPGHETKMNGEGNHGWLSLRVSCCRFDGHLVKLIPPCVRTQQG
jgi:hypothetical protein